MYSAHIKYMFGSGRATCSSSVSTNQLKGNTESAVIEYLRQKHHAYKDLQIVITSIEWK